EGLLLADARLGPLDLLDHVTQVVGLTLDLLAARLELRVTALELTQPLVRIPHRRTLHGRVAVGVEDVALRVWSEQRLRLVLAVEIHQQRAQLGEHAHRGWAAVHPGPRTAFRADLALQDEAPVLRLHAKVGRGRYPFKRCLDHGLVRPRAYDVRRRALAEQQGEGVHQHRLPRPGLAGEAVETGGKGERDVGDDGEIADAQLRQHYWRSRSESSPQCSFLRMGEEAFGAEADEQDRAVGALHHQAISR